MLLYYNPFKMQQKVDAKVKREDIERLKKKLPGATFQPIEIGSTTAAFVTGLASWLLALADLCVNLKT